MEFIRLKKLSGILFGLVLLTLPVTSFRYFPTWFGRTTIQPLAFYPLALLFPLLVYLLWRRGSLRLPMEIVPLLAFILVAVLATVFGGLYAPLDVHGISYLDRVLRGWVSLGIGLAFFIASYLAARHVIGVTRALKWLYIGLGATAVWGLIQAVVVHTGIIDLDFIDNLQLSFSLRPVVNRRISGFANEPAWLSDQLVIFSLPWLVGAILTNYRISRRRWLEPLLLVVCFILLLFTVSRSGIFNGIIVSLLVVLFAGRHLIRSLRDWFVAPFQAKQRQGWTLRIALVLLVLVLAVVAFSMLSRYEYFTNLWPIDLSEGLLHYLQSNFVGARVSYAVAGFRTFSLHPWTGVGFGASGFYLYDLVPEEGINMLPELSRNLSPDSSVLINVKNIYIRLLAETGLIGFWLFVAFFLSILGSIRRLFTAKDSACKFVGTAGFFAWLAIVMRNFSQDSLTFPVMWVVLGMILGFAHRLTSKSKGGL